MLSKLNNTSIQSAVVGAIIFILVANRFIFNHVDRLFSYVLGTRYGSNQYLVLFVHAIVFGLLMYYANKLILRRVFKSIA